MDQVRNLNLRFDTPEWRINLYTFYPGVYRKKGKDTCYVSSNSQVLALTFLNKALVL